MRKTRVEYAPQGHNNYHLIGRYPGSMPTMPRWQSKHGNLDGPPHPTTSYMFYRQVAIVQASHWKPLFDWLLLLLLKTIRHVRAPPSTSGAAITTSAQGFHAKKSDFILHGRTSWTGWDLNYFPKFNFIVNSIQNNYGRINIRFLRSLK